MAIGPGKYDELTEALMSMTMASGIVVIVVGGHRGSGFGAKMTQDIAALMPKVLRDAADEMEKDVDLLTKEHGT